MESLRIEGQGLRWAGEMIEFTSARSLPPGYRCEAVLKNEYASYSVQAKVVGVTRSQHGHFTLRIKLLSLRKEDRTALNDLTSFDLLIK